MGSIRKGDGPKNERGSREEPPLVINGWQLYAYPDFLNRYRALLADFERVRQRDPEGYRNSSAAKILEAVRRLMLTEIPGDPGAERFRQGRSLGNEHRHWRRAKFFQRFRLFFRYHSAARIVILVWLNDENTLRKEGSRSDPYHVFRDMLQRSTPPSGWADLLAASLPVSGSSLTKRDRGGSEK